MREISIIFLTLILCLNNGFSQDQNISNATVFEGEPYLAINPINSNNIVLAWMGFVFQNSPRLSIKIKSSFDSGLTWNSTITMPHIVPTYKSADPSLAFDQNGNLFLSYIDYRESPDSGGVYLFKSADGGLNWGAPTLMIDAYADGDKRPIDRPFLIINEAGDKLYLTSKPAPWIPAPNRPYFVSSSDFGQTWSPFRYLDTTDYLVGPLIQGPFAPATCSANIFHSVYPSYLSTQNVFPQYILASSSDNGNDFTYNSVYAGLNSAQNDSAKISYKLIQNPVNISHLAFIFPGGNFGDFDIFYTESFNAGINWSEPIRLNDDLQGNGKMQDMLWADFDNDGDIVVSWRDRRNAEGIGFNKASEYYASYRDKDSINFSINFKLSDSLVNYNNILNSSGNDFMGMEIENDTIFAAWANTRDGSLDIWFSKINAKNGLVNSLNLISSDSKYISIFPNPSTSLFNIEMIDKSLIEEYKLINTLGEIIYSEKINKNSFNVDLNGKAKGIYFIELNNKGKTIKQKIVKN